MKSHCGFFGGVFFKTRFSFHRDRPSGSRHLVFRSLLLPILALKNSNVSLLNVQIFINYQNVNFKGSKTNAGQVFFFAFFFFLFRRFNKKHKSGWGGAFIRVGLFLLSLKKLKINNTPVGYRDITPH